MSRKSAFTLIELLTVIAIIGILSAIIFPVYSRVKDSAYRSADMSNMNAIRTALQLYKTDQGAYPPQLLGYATLYTTGPNTGKVIPANMVVGCLYPKRVDSINTFKPAYLSGPDAVYNNETTAVWPTGNYGGVGVTSCGTNAGNAACALQAFAPTDGIVSYDANGNVGVTGTPFDYYTVSGYDTAAVRTTNGSQRELHYALFWSAYALCPPASGGSGSAADSLNQLGYSEPPETTVVTWDSYFRDYDTTGAILPSEKRDIVLFLGGSARAEYSVIPASSGNPASGVYNTGFQTQP